MPKYKITYGFVKMGERPEDMKGVGEVVDVSATMGAALVAAGNAEKVAEKETAESPKGDKK